MDPITYWTVVTGYFAFVAVMYHLSTIYGDEIETYLAP